MNVSCQLELIVNFSEEIRNNEIYQSKFLNFQLIWNEGIAFGFLSFENDFIYHSMEITSSSKPRPSLFNKKIKTWDLKNPEKDLINNGNAVPNA